MKRRTSLIVLLAILLTLLPTVANAQDNRFTEYRIKKQQVIYSATITRTSSLNAIVQAGKGNAINSFVSLLPHNPKDPDAILKLTDAEWLFATKIVDIFRNRLTDRERRGKTIEVLRVPVTNMNTVSPGTPTFLSKEKIDLSKEFQVMQLGSIAAGTWEVQQGNTLVQHAVFLSGAQKLGWHQMFTHTFDNRGNPRSVRMVTRIIYFE